jgi:hypothetical protein
MRLRVEAKLRKALRRAEHGLPGLHTMVARLEHRGSAFSDVLCGIVVDPAERWEHRRFLATLLWSTAATKDVCLSMVKLVSSAANTNVLAQYISLWGDRKYIRTAELNLFLRVFASGTLEERRTAVEFSWRISASVDVAGCPSTRLPRQAAPFAQTE